MGCETDHCFLNLLLLLIRNESYLISLEGIHLFSQISNVLLHENLTYFILI